MLFGAVFVLIGVLGFIPNPFVGDDGFFATNSAHDGAHLLIGAALLWASTQTERAASLSLVWTGVIYALLAVLGYATAGAGGHAMLFGTVHVNGNDNWLHVLLAVALIGCGLAGRRSVAGTHHPAHQH
jgi:hypothetical protein